MYRNTELVVAVRVLVSQICMYIIPHVASTYTMSCSLHYTCGVKVGIIMIID